MTISPVDDVVGDRVEVDNILLVSDGEQGRQERVSVLVALP